jgi:hypothetical protein
VETEGYEAAYLSVISTSVERTFRKILNKLTLLCPGLTLSREASCHAQLKIDSFVFGPDATRAP